MDKFLFTDGISGVKEVHSQHELQKLIDATAERGKIRIWLFNSFEWISYEAFCKKNVIRANFEKRDSSAATNNNRSTSTANHATSANSHVTGAGRGTVKGKWLKKFLFLVLLFAGLILGFNFTRISWEKGDTLYASSPRPENMPVRDLDSLVYAVEEFRGQKLDRSTRTNLRLRNSWPERILVQLEAAHETNKNNGSRFSGIEITLDNTTGFMIDNVVLTVTSWNKQSRNVSDTFHFDNIGYSGPVKRLLDSRYRGDSISISVNTIRARSFNFCYSVDATNEENHYDRWFCRDGE